MKRAVVLILIFISINCPAQTGKSNIVRAFPITGYVVELNDSLQVVQLFLPNGPAVADKQIGILKGKYREQKSDTATIGFGRCHLVKGDYYYFTINNKASGRKPNEGDLLYLVFNKGNIYYGQIPKIAAHYIGLKNVYDSILYDREMVFSHWEKQDEETLLNKLLDDIHFTGNYFLQNNPSMNVAIKSGKKAGEPVLNTMIKASREDLENFLDYVIARPSLYAGQEWKISEVFATWLSEGAPSVIKH